MIHSSPQSFHILIKLDQINVSTTVLMLARGSAFQSFFDMAEKRRNSPDNRAPMEEWPVGALEMFRTRLAANKSTTGQPYYCLERMSDAELPPALEDQRCFNPCGSHTITLCYERRQYQRPLHRMMHQLHELRHGRPLLQKEQQSSHICMDAVNVGGRGQRHCCNPDHMVVETDQENKDRQRCAGWIWIQPFAGHEGGYWYPACVHEPPCLRFTPKARVPTVISGS